MSSINNTSASALPEFPEDSASLEGLEQFFYGEHPVPSDVETASMELAAFIEKIELDYPLNSDSRNPIEHSDLFPLAEQRLQKSRIYDETRHLLDLLAQVEEIRQLLADTNERLLRAHSRVSHMERVVEEQDHRLALLPYLEAQAERALELQDRLDAALDDIERMRQPWWQRLMKRI